MAKVAKHAHNLPREGAIPSSAILFVRILLLHIKKGGKTFMVLSRNELREFLKWLDYATLNNLYGDDEEDLFAARDLSIRVSSFVTESDTDHFVLSKE